MAFREAGARRMLPAPALNALSVFGLLQVFGAVGSYLALDVLKKTGREMIDGCTRVATTGMSAPGRSQALIPQRAARRVVQ